jgi:diacylglycerol kinase family enzyme
VTFHASLPGIGVIYNPRSSYNRRDPSAGPRLERALGSHGVVRKVDSIDALYRAAADFKQLDIDLLAISGGDGTTGVSLSGFLEVYAGAALPKVALLRGGTANTLADSVGIPRGKPERLLQRLVTAHLGRDLRAPRETARHVMRLQGENSRRRDAVSASLPASTAIHGFLCGVGVVSGFLEAYYASGPPSARVAAETLVKGIGSTLVQGPMIRRMAAPFRGSVELDDGTRWEERDYLSIAAGTIHHIGLGFKPFHRVAHDQPAFHLLGIYTSPAGFVTQLPNIWRGRPMSPGHTYEALAKRARLHAQTPTIDYMVDGDLYACEGPLEVSIGPSVRIVIPDA